MVGGASVFTGLCQNDAMNDERPAEAPFHPARCALAPNAFGAALAAANLTWFSLI
jgi:hypothetical protein